MTLYVTEHYGVGNLYRQPANKNDILAAYSLSSASVAPNPQAGTQYIRVTADAGMYLCLDLSSSGTTLTSTNSFRIAPNCAGELFAVSTANKIQAQST